MFMVDIVLALMPSSGLFQNPWKKCHQCVSVTVYSAIGSALLNCTFLNLTINLGLQLGSGKCVYL